MRAKKKKKRIMSAAEETNKVTVTTNKATVTKVGIYVFIILIQLLINVVCFGCLIFARHQFLHDYYPKMSSFLHKSYPKSHYQEKIDKYLEKDWPDFIHMLNSSTWNDAQSAENDDKWENYDSMTKIQAIQRAKYILGWTFLFLVVNGCAPTFMLLDLESIFGESACATAALYILIVLVVVYGVILFIFLFVGIVLEGFGGTKHNNIVLCHPKIKVNGFTLAVPGLPPKWWAILSMVYGGFAMLSCFLFFCTVSYKFYDYHK